MTVLTDQGTCSAPSLFLVTLVLKSILDQALLLSKVLESLRQDIPKPGCLLDKGRREQVKGEKHNLIFKIRYLAMMAGVWLLCLSSIFPNY